MLIFLILYINVDNLFNFTIIYCFFGFKIENWHMLSDQFIKLENYLSSNNLSEKKENLQQIVLSIARSTIIYLTQLHNNSRI